MGISWIGLNKYAKAQTATPLAGHGTKRCFKTSNNISARQSTSKTSCFHFAEHLRNQFASVDRKTYVPMGLTCCSDMPSILIVICCGEDTGSVFVGELAEVAGPLRPDARKNCEASSGRTPVSRWRIQSWHSNLSQPRSSPIFLLLPVWRHRR